MHPDFQEPGDPETIAAALAHVFARRLGRPPEVLSVAPGRVNLIGEHVDYNGGRCLPLALPSATYVAAARRDDQRVRITSLQQASPWSGRLGELGPGSVEGWACYPAGVLWALRQDGFEIPGVDLVVDGRVPLGAGLSSSAALECSVAVAVTSLLGLRLDDTLRHRLVRACIRAEREVAGAPTGGMDQTCSLFAREGHALLLDCAEGSFEQVPWDLAGTGLALLVIDTRASHALVDGGYASRRADCEHAARLLGVSTLREVREPERALASLSDPRLQRRTRHVLTELRRVEQAVACLRRGDHPGFGRMLDASHASLRDDFEVSCPELDVAVEAARAQGALGARMTGGGFGGSAIALLPAARLETAVDGIAGAFAARGWRSPGFLLARAGSGARVLRTAHTPANHS